MGRLRDEDGVALVLALAFLTFFGLVIAAILGFAEASVRATEGLREQRDIVYAADGAMDGAIQYARTAAGRDAGVGAFGTQPTCSWEGCIPCITYSATLNGKTATVTCVSTGEPNVLLRQALFTASVYGVARVTAEVAFDDQAATPVPIDVLSWTYLR